MIIEHAAVYVENLESARNFFVQYFNAVSNEGYHNVKTDFKSYFLSFDGGARLEIMNKPGLIKNDNKANSYGYAHLAFSVGSRKRVDELTASLKSDGFVVTSGPRVTGDGYYESCVVAVEGLMGEITV